MDNANNTLLVMKMPYLQSLRPSLSRIVVSIVVLCSLSWSVDASLGDQMSEYKFYEQECVRRNCSSHNLIRFETQQTFYHRLLGWDCHSECQHQSQWAILEELKEHNIKIVPQFYGKWTFYRFFGIQEPASFFFSVLNFASNTIALHSYNKLENNVDPMASLYRAQAYVAMNAWLWSIVYHARDSKITEYLDYFFAYTVALFSLYQILIKWLHDFGFEIEKRMQLNLSIPFVAMYCYHFYYLFFLKFDYSYNMKVNITTGVISSILWLTWCARSMKYRPHVWKCILTFISINVFVLLELFDFPPIAYIFDAHSLWHATTIPLPFLWFSFARAEADYTRIVAKLKQF